MGRRLDLASLRCGKSLYELLHFVDLTSCSKACWQFIHGLELLKRQAFVFTGRSTQCLCENGEGGAELVLVSTNELFNLLLVQDEIELGNRTHLESLSCLLIFVCLDGEKNNIFIFISCCHCFINRFESHAGWAFRRPEVNHNSIEVMNYSFELSHSRDLANLAQLRSCWGLLCGTASQIALNLGTHGWVLHCLCCHAFHTWWNQTRWDSSWKASRLLPTSLGSPSTALERKRITWFILFLGRCRAIVSIEQWVGILHQALLLLHHHWRNLLAHGRIQEFLRQVDDVFRNAFAKDHSCDLVGEVVAVMSEYIIGRRSVLVWDTFE